MKNFKQLERDLKTLSLSEAKQYFIGILKEQTEYSEADVSNAEYFLQLSELEQIEIIKLSKEG